MSKVFKTIVVEHLDKEENEDVVNILNQIISHGIVGSGSKAFMYAVRQYPRNTQIIASLKSSLEQTKAELETFRRNARKFKEVIAFVSSLDSQDPDSFHSASELLNK
ncbi:hypothetical protein [Dyadobacter psychrotolerans]|jgi:hypothetical protein|uniref:Uncharacterized protein n=1 Tax=Dyadobacter psychrotolerans TaxID=2541721 RepID=A0A4R5DAG6_9BACT|nr:hypothetical protein [Dyadobacter psychrotolerans]TDE09827.1 hypothetical protein E0F88_30005 [Dyadobacter psychrotolerans]